MVAFIFIVLMSWHWYSSSQSQQRAAVLDNASPASSAGADALPSDVLVPVRTPGLGELTVENGSPENAIVKLADGDYEITGVFVRSGDVFTVRGIPAGRYRLLFCLGTGLIVEAQKFRHGAGCLAFVEELVFEETKDQQGALYREYRVTLQPVPGGSAKTVGVSEDEFDAVGQN